MLIPALIGFAVIALLTRGAGKGSSMTPPQPSHDWMREIWNTALPPFAITAGINVAFAIQWCLMESGGNPCAIGKPGAKGPDGEPREIGIGQFYNPDDFIKLKISTKSMRAYCASGTDAVIRPLTADEIKAQAQALMDLIAVSKASASSDLRKVGATWPHEGRDYYRLTKLQHALPGLSHSGLPAVAQYLSRAPSGWDEFRSCLMNVTLDDGTERYRSEFDRILDNAEKCGNVVTDSGVA
jgi:hypothetical protein